MNTQPNWITAQPGLVQPSSAFAHHPRFSRALYRAAIAPIKVFWGLLFCQSIAGSILVVGWSYRLAQRSALKLWWSRRQATKLSFEQFLEANEETIHQRHWPNWFLEQNARQRLRFAGNRVAVRLVRGILHSVWVNFWIGFRAIANTWILTLPACLLWWFGWYDGWNNSFNKGYEQAPVGPLISILGIILFIAVMFYLPLAQARQAVTGDWRSFFQFRLIWKIVRLRYLSGAGLAFLYALLALPLNILKTWPMFQPQAHAALANLTDLQVLEHLNRYFFFCALAVLPAYVLLRVIAARVYASGILALVQARVVPREELAPLEAQTLQSLGLLEQQPARERHVLLRVIAWTGTGAGRVASTFVLIFLWFAFIAQIYVAEFLNYHQGIGWINQPLVQLPWFHFLPARLKNPWNEFLSAILIWLLACLLAKIFSVLRTKRTQT